MSPALLRDRLGIDPSFLTRVLTRLQEQGLVTMVTSDIDGRRLTVSITAAGRAALRVLDERSADQIEQLVAPLTAGQRRTMSEAMTVITNLIGANDGSRTLTLRGLLPGDMGWVIQRHGEIYFDEYGWDSSFEALVAGIVADYHANHLPGRENAWIAEVDGARAGCVFCCRRDEDTGQLRILLVESWARGSGTGSRLVDECVGFARSAGYRSIMLWTNDVLVSARRIYEAAGFRLVVEERHNSFGRELVGQNWELTLSGDGGTRRALAPEQAVGDAVGARRDRPRRPRERGRDPVA